MMSVEPAVAIVADWAEIVSSSPTAAVSVPSTCICRESVAALIPSGTVSSSSWTPTVAPLTV